MTQHNKLQIALRRTSILIPSTYPVLRIREYCTIYYLLRSYSKKIGESYSSIKMCYNDYLGGIGSSDRYINTKYYQPKIKGHRQSCFRIQALAGNPVMVALDNTSEYTIDNYIFMLLHELGHLYYTQRRSNKKGKEYYADLFAIRWFKRYKNGQNIKSKEK